MTDRTDEARSRLILALDVPDLGLGLDLLERIGDRIGAVKVGLELFAAAGPAAVESIARLGHRVFLDLKLHDIPNTVAGAVRAARSSGASMLTVHTGGGLDMLRGAVEAAGGDLLVLGVTLLTSLDEGDLAPISIAGSPEDVVLRRASLARQAGCGGVVCSPMEVRRVREVIGGEPAVVVPGIRPERTAAGDQKRAATPASAIGAGASHLVVGRPIRSADDPARAADEIVGEIAGALARS